MVEKRLTASVEFLGVQRTVTGISSLDIDVNDGMSVLDALTCVITRFPGLNLDADSVVFSVNGEKSPAERFLKGGEKILFLPSVGGG
jgi:molybdopterin converting factor small subunit